MSESMYCPPPDFTSVDKASSGASLVSRSNNHSEASLASRSPGQRAMISLPPFLRRRSTVSKIGDGSTTKTSFDQGTTGEILPFWVLHCLWARRSIAAAPFLTRVAAKLSTLGPRSEFTDASGSTGLSQSQQIQLSCSPTWFRSLIPTG